MNCLPVRARLNPVYLKVGELTTSLWNIVGLSCAASLNYTWIIDRWHLRRVPPLEGQCQKRLLSIGDSCQGYLCHDRRLVVWKRLLAISETSGVSTVIAD
jgi:hypothetical protein